MDIGMREILIVLGCLIMAVLFIDAYRRVRDHRRSQLGHRLHDHQSSMAPSLDGFDDDALYDADDLTPVRPVEQRDGPIGQGHLSGRKRSQGPSPQQIRVRISTPKNHHEPVRHDDLFTADDTQAPDAPIPAAPMPRQEPRQDVSSKPEQMPSANTQSAKGKEAAIRRKQNRDNLFPELKSRKTEAPIKALLQPALATAPEDGDFYSNRRRSQASVSARKQQAERERQEEQPAVQQQSADPTDVIVMHVAAGKDEVFEGEVLVQQLLALNLRHGDMKIFHRYERPEQHQGLLFSMANMVKPGYFELDHMNAFDTPGVTFFLSLPCNGGALYAFDLMVDTARKLAKTLDGELRDETQSMITAQTVEHFRQRVMEFERKQRMLEKTRQIRERSKLFD